MWWLLANQMFIWVILEIANTDMSIFISIPLRNRLLLILLFFKGFPFRNQKICKSNWIIFSWRSKIMRMKITLFCRVSTPPHDPPPEIILVVRSSEVWSENCFEPLIIQSSSSTIIKIHETIEILKYLFNNNRDIGPYFHQSGTLF